MSLKASVFWALDWMFNQQEIEMPFTADYSIKMQDSTGRVFELGIIGACIDEQIANGTPEWEAREGVESNAFANAIYRGEIGEDAWITA